MTNQNDQADAIVEEFWQMFVRGAPHVTQIVFRFFRAIAVFFAGYSLMSAQPYHVGGHAAVGLAIAMLSFANITKWLSVAALAFLLVIALVPKSLFAMISAAVFR